MLTIARYRINNYVRARTLYVLANRSMANLRIILSAECNNLDLVRTISAVLSIQTSDNRLHVDLVCVTFGTHARGDTWVLSREILCGIKPVTPTAIARY